MYANLKRFHYKIRKTKQSKKVTDKRSKLIEFQWPRGGMLACKVLMKREQKNGQRKKFFNCGTNLRQRGRKNYHNRTIQSAQEEINVGKKYRNNGKQVKEKKFN